MAISLIVLNGASSSGKTVLARSLQTVLPGSWLAFSIDGLVDAMPPTTQQSSDGIAIDRNGQVSVGADFRRLEMAWMRGLAETARAGARVIVDDVFLGGADSQRRWEIAVGELAVCWVGVRCDPTVAASREAARGDRVVGMHASQAGVVHEGVHYDIEVDTSRCEPLECARAIVAKLQ